MRTVSGRCPRADHGVRRSGARRAAARWVAVTLKPSVMVLLICALAGAGQLHVLPAVPGLDGARSKVDELQLELAGRWRCDTATRRALLTDGDAERLYADVQAACPAAADPLTLR
jgi:hypothetical protein